MYGSGWSDDPLPVRRLGSLACPALAKADKEEVEGAAELASEKRMNWVLK